ncbi:MAG: Holliday junction branch migration protein RuvA [Candidatus Pacebacteria bacterium]|nr:Holliday junction branch migration protein RuvA [Candidatus Paceibacterota bacterium]
MSMIGRISGKLIEKHPLYGIIDVGGLGYKVHATLPTLGQVAIGEDITLHTYLHVRENTLDLYGFENEEEKFFFELLLSVSGIGPKSAVGILNIASPDSLKSAISAGDTTHLVKVSGIGKKSAQKIILELKDKIGDSIEGDPLMMQDEVDTMEALVSLGYPEKEVREVLQKIPKDISGAHEKIKEALKILG